MIHYICPRNGEVAMCPYRERDPQGPPGSEFRCGVVAPHRREMLVPKHRVRDIPYCDFHKIAMVPA